MRGKITELHVERDRFRERGAGLSADRGGPVEELPGMRRVAAWRAMLGARLGGAAPSSPAPPEGFWTPARRRLAEEAKVAYLQAKAAAKKTDQYQVEIQKKFSIPSACIIFVLVGAPLGIRARRGGMAAGFLSAGFFMFYYLCLVGGEQLADRHYLTPWIAMWLPNMALAVLGIALSLRVCEIRIGPDAPPAAPSTPARPEWGMIRILDRHVLREFMLYLLLGFAHASSGSTSSSTSSRRSTPSSTIRRARC